MLTIFFCLGMLCKAEAYQKAGDSSRLTIAYTLSENDLVPEGIAYDPVTSSFFLSSTYKRKIVRVDVHGNVSDLAREQQDGLMGVVGMRVDAKHRVLWAACGNVGRNMPMKNGDSTQEGFTGLFKYDLRSGNLIHKYLLSVPGEKHFFNDLTLDKTGKPYVTDTWNQKIYTLNPTKDQLDVFLDVAPLYTPNGIDISADNKYLYVAMYASPKAVIGRVEIATRELQLVNLGNEPMSGADGLYCYKNSLVAMLPNQPKDTITQFFLDKTGTAVTKSFIHIAGNRLLSQPTTGVIVGDKLYFVATSNLHLFRKMYEDQNGRVDPGQLPPVRIAVIELHKQ